MRRLAVLSMHTSPLIQPGSGDAGGMNVYVRELVSSLAQAGVACTVYVRRYAAELPAVVEVEPGFRVVHVDAGPPELPKEELASAVDDYTEGVRRDIEHGAEVDAIHANYWLSGLAGHRIKHELDLPLVSTFHTLARVKAETGDPEPGRRVEAEAAVIGCSDAILANSREEADQLVRHYGADARRVEVVPPGVDHAFFSPGSRQGARAALELGDHPVLVFVGRIQPLKGLDVAVGALGASRHPDAVLVVVGGASGAEGAAELDRVQRLADELGVRNRLRFVSPRPHHELSTYYRAADVCLVPSRSESFGLVALEAAACGTPVVAAGVGGLLTVVRDGVTGSLVESRAPAAFAAAVDQILDSPAWSRSLSRESVAMAARYTWPVTAARLRRLYADLTSRELVQCQPL